MQKKFRPVLYTLVVGFGLILIFGFLSWWQMTYYHAPVLIGLGMLIIAGYFYFKAISEE